MKTSPYVRIREKNRLIEGYKSAFEDIASVLSCKPELLDIMSSLVEAQQWKGSYMTAMVENDGLMKKMGESIKDQVDKITFSTQLENNKLKLEVERLNKIIDTTNHDIQKIKQENKIPKKGFWDFMYKVFKVI